MGRNGIQGKHAMGGLGKLTVREAEVLGALLKGIDIEGIADMLVISIATARTHIRNLHAKTDTHNLVQLLAWGRDAEKPHSLL